MDLDGAAGMSGAEPIGSQIGLGQGEGAATSAEPNRPVRKRGRERHAPEARNRDEIRVAPSKSEAHVSGRFGEVASIQNLRNSRYSVQILHVLRF